MDTNRSTSVDEQMEGLIAQMEMKEKEQQVSALMRKMGVGIGTRAMRNAVAQTQTEAANAFINDVCRQAREASRMRRHFPNLTFLLQQALYHPDWNDPA